MSESSTEAARTRTSTASTKPAPFELTTEQINDFRQDGVIVVRGLLHGEMLEKAMETVEAMNSDTTFKGVYRNLKVQNFQTEEAFRRVAFESSAPTICAKLMGLHDEEHSHTHRSLRLLKDGIFGMSRGDKGCGWHVDDKFFWPCEDIHNDNNDNNDTDSGNESSAQPTATATRRIDAGINVWITLSPVTATEGGGLAVAPRTHDITGSGSIGCLTRRARKTIATRGGLTTCELQSLAPDDHDQLEAIKRVYDLAPGDAIVHDRYVFHRADPFRDNETKKSEIDDDSNNDNDNDGAHTNGPKFRISLRYMPSDATFFNTGSGREPAVAQKQLKTGDPLWKAEECFPQVWPYTLEEEVQAFA